VGRACLGAFRWEGGRPDHHTLGGGHHGQSATAAWALLTGWALMVVAMMPPPALPMLDLVRRLLARHWHPAWLVAVAAVAFVGIWTATGAALVSGGAGVHAVARHAPGSPRTHS
jgi:predicted metal-binding membrane protein